jgi:hypothetical protein
MARGILEAPELDDRTWQDLVEQATALIQELHCLPEPPGHHARSRRSRLRMAYLHFERKEAGRRAEGQPGLHAADWSRRSRGL